MPDFDFAVLGAGAMGSIVGGHLARAGHSVVMLARGERAQQLERHGLTIKGLVAFSTPVTTLREPAALKSAGALIVAMKTPATAAALAALRHADFGVTLSIQNGPLKNELLAQAFGKERVLGALADTSGELLPDGAVLFTRNVSILVGELSGGQCARATPGPHARRLGRARRRDPRDPDTRVVEVLCLGRTHGLVGDHACAHLEVSAGPGLRPGAGTPGARDGSAGAHARHRPE